MIVICALSFPLSPNSTQYLTTFALLNSSCRNNSAGIPHILEHSVLCGSRKYPLKEPFVELLKGSLHTFLNAFTYPDRTCYPVASTNTKVKSRLLILEICSNEPSADSDA